MFFFRITKNIIGRINQKYNFILYNCTIEKRKNDLDWNTVLVNINEQIIKFWCQI